MRKRQWEPPLLLLGETGEASRVRDQAIEAEKKAKVTLARNASAKMETEAAEDWLKAAGLLAAWWARESKKKTRPQVRTRSSPWRLLSVAAMVAMPGALPVAMATTAAAAAATPSEPAQTAVAGSSAIDTAADSVPVATTPANTAVAAAAAISQAAEAAALQSHCRCGTSWCK